MAGDTPTILSKVGEEIRAKYSPPGVNVRNESAGVLLKFNVLATLDDGGDCKLLLFVEDVELLLRSLRLLMELTLIEEGVSAWTLCCCC